MQMDGLLAVILSLIVEWLNLNNFRKSVHILYVATSPHTINWEFLCKIDQATRWVNSLIAVENWNYKSLEYALIEQAYNREIFSYLQLKTSQVDSMVPNFFQN